jgi:hypothetical protein
MCLRRKKMQIYGCKHVLSFEKFRKVPRGKFPPEKYFVSGEIFLRDIFRKSSRNPGGCRTVPDNFFKKNFYNFIKNFIKNFYNFIKNFIKNFYNFIKDFIKNFYNFIKNFIKNFYNFIKNFIKNFYNFTKYIELTPYTQTIMP